MDEQALRVAIAELLEVAQETLSDNDELESFAAYDSTAKLSLMVCLSDFAAKPLGMSDLEKMRTVGDVIRLVRDSS
jgi:acyl carrier protein